jgi:manganese efflux pump family protein
MLQTVLIAIGLSMDAFAVSLSSGMCTKELSPLHVVRGAFSFGLFQFLMPVVGWLLGITLRGYIAGFDHWIAFALLFFIGAKMVVESRQTTAACDDEEEDGRSQSLTDVRDIRTLLTLSVATSIDALAVGLSFSLLGTSVWGPAATIGGITFAVCLAGFEFGKRIGSVLERWAETIGGLVLIGIGLKILIEHLLIGK